MFSAIASIVKSLVALWTGIRFFSGVSSEVGLQVLHPGVGPVAAFVLRLSGVASNFSFGHEIWEQK